MSRKFAITDIHGCLKTFESLLDKIEFTSSDRLVLVGDYIDRGPDSKGVMDFIMKLKTDGYNLTTLRGNHEQGMINSKSDVNLRSNWMSWGGRETLASLDIFDAIHINKVKDLYWEFMNNLEYVVEEDEFILVHAGLNFELNDPMIDFHDCLWIRKWYQDIKYDWLGDRIIVHGHTPLGQTDMEAQLINLDKQQYLCIDNGCYFIQKPEMGQLCAFDMTNRSLHFQKNVDMTERWMRR